MNGFRLGPCRNPDIRPCDCETCEWHRDQFRTRTRPGAYEIDPGRPQKYYIRQRMHKPKWDCGPWVWMTYCIPYERLEPAIARAVDLHLDTKDAVRVVDLYGNTRFYRATPKQCDLLHCELAEPCTINRYL